MTVELIEIGPLVRRRRCDCCGFPSIRMPDEFEADPEWELTFTACDLCEWESRPLDRAGDIREDGPSDEERNDGLDRTTARANFARFLSIYDPDEPPVWRVSPLSDEVIAAREALRSAYLELLALDVPGRYEQWGHVRRCELALFDALAVQRNRDEGY